MAASARALAALALLHGAACFDIGNGAGGAGAAGSIVFEKDAPRSAALQHALADSGGGVRSWSERATLTFRDGPGRPSAHIGSASLDGAAMESFRELVRTRNAYSVRLPSDLSDPHSAGVIASIPACALAASSFAERLVVQLDTVGHVVALGYTAEGAAAAPPSAAACEALAAKLPPSVALNPRLELRFPADGAFPVGRATGTAPGKPAGAAGAAGSKDGEGGEKEAPKSFFMKYWYYIVPAMIILSLGGNDQPAAQGGEGGAQGGGGGGGARPAARQ